MVYSLKEGEIMKFLWLVYLQILFTLHAFLSKRTWIDKHILICYNKLEKLNKSVKNQIYYS